MLSESLSGRFRPGQSVCLPGLSDVRNPSIAGLVPCARVSCLSTVGPATSCLASGTAQLHRQLPGSLRLSIGLRAAASDAPPQSSLDTRGGPSASTWQRVATSAAADASVTARLRPHKSGMVAHLVGTMLPMILCFSALGGAAYTGWQKMYSDPDLARMLLLLPGLSVLLVAGFIVSQLSGRARRENGG